MAEREPVLCYVSGDWAYFTTQDLGKQWGDDWNDAPYDCNAGRPYIPYGKDEHWEITKVAFEGPLEAPCDRSSNCGLSVQDINTGAVPWLRTYDYAKHQVRILPGTSMRDFINLVQLAGGRVYVDLAWAAAQGKGERW